MMNFSNNLRCNAKKAHEIISGELDYYNVRSNMRTVARLDKVCLFIPDRIFHLGITVVLNILPRSI